MHCIHWSPFSLFQAESTSTKIADFVSELVKVINTECQTCEFSSSQFGLLQFICGETQISSNFSSLQGRVVGNGRIHSTEVIALLQQWINTSPIVLIGGGRYTVTADCIVSIDDIGSPLCMSASEVNTADSDTGGTSNSSLATAALVISIMAIVLMGLGFTVCTFLHLRGKHNRLVKITKNPSWKCVCYIAILK